jgi:hypothetical protein
MRRFAEKSALAEELMTDSIDPTRSFKPVQNRQQEELQQRQQPEKGKVSAEDRVSLSQAEKTEATYGPQSALNIGTPYELLRSLVIKTLEEQNIPLLISTGDVDINLNDMTVEEAQELVAEDGYFGVEKTSQRIVDFAINAFGNDPAKLDEMKQAIIQGFEEAQEAFGGMLPEISQQTYDAIMQKLDDFAFQSDESGE